jgi:transcriptional regulator with XRE-family HTH domain
MRQRRRVPAGGVHAEKQQQWARLIAQGVTSNCAPKPASPRPELAERIGASDARQISRYEHGRITPSLDATIRIAQALNVSLDYLAIENVPRRPLHVEDHGLAERLGQLAELDEDERQSLLRVLDAFLTRKRLHALTAADGR